MNMLLELPVLLLLLPFSVRKAAFSAGVYLLCCWMIRKDYRKKLHTRSLGGVVLSVLIPAWLACGFYTRWLPSGSVARLAGLLHLSPAVLLIGAASVLAAASVPGVYCFVECVMEGKGMESDSPHLREDALRLSFGEVAFCLIIALFTALQFSLRPFSSRIPFTDSSVFLYIGKMMHQGRIPYRDLFDHKGPFLYLVEYLGMFLTTEDFPGLGVWLLEICNMFGFTAAILMIAKLISPHKSVQYATAWFIPLFAGQVVYEGGNLVEEYALPWTAIALYIFLKYFLLDRYTFREIVLLGLSFMAVFLLRENMIAVWLVFMPIIFVSMLWRKQFSDLGRCVAAFVIGCCLLAVPLVIYCLCFQCLTDLIDIYYFFNLSYSKSYTSFLRILENMLFLLNSLYIPIPLLLIAFALSLRSKIGILNDAAFLVTLILISISGVGHNHYAIQLLPVMVVYSALVAHGIYCWVQKCIPRRLDKWLTFSGKGAMAVFLLAATVVTALYTTSFVTFLSPEKRRDPAITAYLKENTLPQDDVLILGNDCYHYLAADRATTNKYFYQTPPIDIRAELADSFRKELEIHPSDIIVVAEKREMVFSRQDQVAAVCADLETNPRYTCEVLNDFFVYRCK